MQRNRARRRNNNKNLIRNRKRLLKHVDASYGKHFEGKENKLAVKHPLDCGKTDCSLCHSHKVRGCESKNKDQHILLERQIAKELRENE